MISEIRSLFREFQDTVEDLAADKIAKHLTRKTDKEPTGGGGGRSYGASEYMGSYLEDSPDFCNDCEAFEGEDA